LPPLLLLRRQLLELLRAQHLAVADRRQRQAHRRADDGEALLPRAFLQSIERLLLLLLELLLDDCLAVAVFLTLDCRRQRQLQLLDQPLDVVVQRPRPPRR
jgi:hypothetical protein